MGSQSSFMSLDKTSLELLRPTLFIGGAESDYIPVTDHDEIQETFPVSTFSYVQGAGHWVHSQKPKEVMELMVDFLK